MLGPLSIILSFLFRLVWLGKKGRFDEKDCEVVFDIVRVWIVL